MKKTVFTLVLVFILNSFLIIQNCQAQWQPDFRLTNDTSGSNISDNNAWCVASSGSLVHIAWRDSRDGNYEIYYKRSSDAGLSWGADTRLTNNSSYSGDPSVAVSGSAIHVVWTDYREGNSEIFYKRSTDAGISWGTDTRLSNIPVNSEKSSVAVSGPVVYVAWTDYRDGPLGEIYYKRSTDAGISWGADTRLTNNTAISIYPSVAVSGSVVHIVWQDTRDGNEEIYNKCSTNGGVSWGADTRLSNISLTSENPSIAISASIVHVVWMDHRNGIYEQIYYKRSTDAGISWEEDVRITNTAEYSWNPSVTLSGMVVHVVWQDTRNGNSEIYYKRSTDSGINWGTDIRLTNNNSYSWKPFVAVSDSVVHVVWQDNRDGNEEIYYKRNPTGNPIGIQNISSEVPSSYSLSQNYPNPFNPISNIKYKISKSTEVRITVFDVTGKEVEVLVDEKQSPGEYLVTFDGTNYPSGVYFYKISAGDFSETKRLTLLK